MRLIHHVIFWAVVAALLTIVFGFADGEYLRTFYFVSFLIPVAIGTSYFFNYYLVPRFLLQKRYWRFGMYALYTLVTSIYLEFLVLTLAFIVLANYQYEELNPYSANILLLTFTLYLIVFINSFFRLIKQYQLHQLQIAELKHAQQKNAQNEIIIRVDRKNCPVLLDHICYVESLADYVRIHTTEAVLITKEKISELQKKLPDSFIRIHRSFLVNRVHISKYGREEIEIGESTLPISRTYRKSVLEQLEG
ncbi:MAG: LytTR family DNA-binding domain-containing protein [Cyclobacteriaceae bacterium]